MHSDLPLDQLRTYRYSRPEPADFDAFWARTLAEAGRFPVEVVAEPFDSDLRTIDAHDVTFAGWNGAPIKAWLLRPAGVDAPLPVIVEYLGYGSGRGQPHESLVYASAGFAHLVMDTRGQGSTWRPGDTPDPEGTPPAIPGSMTKGITDPDTYYYRRLYVDAVRAVDAVKTLPGIDPDRIVVTGRSQGGALSIVAAALRDDVSLAVPHVPFLSAWERALALTNREPCAEIVRWLAQHRTKADAALHTLGYFDATYFASRATCPGSFCVALMDGVCPPSTVFAAYNNYAGPKDLTIWPYNDHEGGGPEDFLRTIRRARAVFDGVAAGIG